MPSEGASGGLISICDDKVICSEEVLKSQRCLAAKVKSLGVDFQWAMANVYGPDEEREKALFLNSIISVQSQWPIPWCIGGDFNMIRFPQEKKRGRFISVSMSTFSNSINSQELVDLPLVGRRFTWTNN